MAGSLEPTERQTLAAIIQQCEHALGDHLARRYATRDRLKALERRCQALLKQEDGRTWGEEFARITVTAGDLFEDLIEECGATEQYPQEH